MWTPIPRHDRVIFRLLLAASDELVAGHVERRHTLNMQTEPIAAAVRRDAASDPPKIAAIFERDLVKSAFVSSLVGQAPQPVGLIAHSCAHPTRQDRVKVTRMRRVLDALE